MKTRAKSTTEMREGQCMMDTNLNRRSHDSWKEGEKCEEESESLHVCDFGFEVEVEQGIAMVVASICR